FDHFRRNNLKKLRVVLDGAAEFRGAGFGGGCITLLDRRLGHQAFRRVQRWEGFKVLHEDPGSQSRSIKICNCPSRTWVGYEFTGRSGRVTHVPVLTSNSQPCSGQNTRPSLKKPSPSGPPL